MVEQLKSGEWDETYGMLTFHFIEDVEECIVDRGEHNDSPRNAQLQEISIHVFSDAHGHIPPVCRSDLTFYALASP